MSDIWTMIWKESKELIFQSGWAQLVRALLVIGIVGVAFPWRAGTAWLDLSIFEMLALLWVPYIYIISFIGDAVAGERERHTLETLLASRMPDRAILLGKIIVTVVYAWGTALAILLLSPAIVSLTTGSWAFYRSLDLFLEAVALAFLISLFAASAGVLISLRVATVRQAQQILIIGTIVLIFGAILVISVLPAGLFSSLSYPQFLLIVTAVLALLDALLLGLSLASFRRSHLISL
ncbi:MAG: ABC transporter permease [Chloroflexota bacterium]